jgi:hypothetical protein
MMSKTMRASLFGPSVFVGILVVWGVLNTVVEATVQQLVVQPTPAEIASGGAASDSPFTSDLPATGSVADLSEDEFVEQAMAIAAAELRGQLPMKVDELTTLLSVMSLKKTIMYSYRLEVPPGADLTTWELEQAARLEANVCGDTNMRNTIARGGSYRYMYADQTGYRIFDKTIDNCSSGL